MMIVLSGTKPGWWVSQTCPQDRGKFTGWRIGFAISGKGRGHDGSMRLAFGTRCVGLTVSAPAESGRQQIAAEGKHAGEKGDQAKLLQKRRTWALRLACR